MEAHTFFLHLMVILLAARLFGELAVRLGAPAVLGGTAGGGGTLTATSIGTSIGITIRALTDLKRHNSLEGQVVLGVAVLDDIMGVVLLALLYEFSLSGGVNVGNAGKIICSCWCSSSSPPAWPSSSPWPSTGPTTPVKSLV
jgi:Kef-type K+ transport system membrane component KefB